MKITIASTSLDYCWGLNKIMHINYLALQSSKYLNIDYYWYYYIIPINMVKTDVIEYHYSKNIQTLRTKNVDYSF